MLGRCEIRKSADVFEHVQNGNILPSYITMETTIGVTL